MASASDGQRPAWQLDELEEEWVEQDIEVDQEHEEDARSQSLIEVSNGRFDDPFAGYTSPNDPGSNLVSSIVETNEAGAGPGTFIIREDQPSIPMNKVKHQLGGMKDFFSPLALEKMFDPPPPKPIETTPSPPPVPALRYNKTAAVFAPSKLSQQINPDPTLTDIEEQVEQVSEEQASRSMEPDHILETDLPNGVEIDGRIFVNREYQFTFSPPSIGATSTPMLPNTSIAVTPKPLEAALTDPRLKLFQLNYDTYTREHLSAIVDSIPITPSRSGSEDIEIRNPKRIKLSPPDPPPSNSHSGLSRRDYVGESRSLMSAIRKNTRSVSLEVSESERSHLTALTTMTKRASDCDTVSTMVDHINGALANEIPEPSPMPKTSTRNILSTGTYRRNAAALMSAIKAHVDFDKSHSRGLSSSTIVSNSEKENVPIHEQSAAAHDRTTTSSHSSKPKRTDPSPRKLLRRISAADEVDKEIAAEVSLLSVSVDITTAYGYDAPMLVVSTEPPLEYPTGYQEVVANPIFLNPTGNPFKSNLEERTASQTSSLNRYITSSTTTHSSAQSVPSLVKHVGPPQAKITNIAPADIPTIPQKVGRMVFDYDRMVWVKDRRTENGVPQGETEDSEDVFRDIESLTGSSHHHADSTQRTNFHHGDDSTLTVDSFGVVAVMTGIPSVSSDDEDDDGPLTGFYTGQHDDDDSEDEGYDLVENGTVPEDSESNRNHSQIDSDDEVAGNPSSPTTPNLTSPPPTTTSGVAANFNTPLPHRRPNGPPRSVLKSGSATPVAIMSQGHRRSVSFSDGRKDGRIKGLHTDESDSATASEREREGLKPAEESNAGMVSSRTKRLQAQLDELGEASFIDTPSKRMGSVTLPAQKPDPLRTSLFHSTRQREQRELQRSTTFRGAPSPLTKGNVTLLTECSFGVAHDKLVQIITDVHPYEPYWEDLSSIDLSNKRIESATRLKEFLPKLTELNINSNQLSWLSGIPGTLRKLSAESNRLTTLTSFNHLLNLSVLDVSHNDIDSVSQLSCLKRLQELRADGNAISSLSGLETLEKLRTLSLKRNALEVFDCATHQWPRLESLDLSGNKLEAVEGLANLVSLQTLALEENALKELAVDGNMPEMHVLKLSKNHVCELDVACFPNLRTLYADHNRLGYVKHCHRLSKLENLSIRSQHGKCFDLTLRDVRDVKRLYLSGNKLGRGFFEEEEETPCYNLVYLEMAGCQLDELPRQLSSVIPNVRVLNLNYNFLTELSGLDGLTRLRKLTVIGARIGSTKGLVRAIRGLVELEMLDLRMNPCTLQLYSPLLMKEKEAEWEEMDERFRRGLPDDTYVRRLGYRGIMMRACGKMKKLDGIGIVGKERKKAMALLSALENI